MAVAIRKVSALLTAAVLVLGLVACTAPKSPDQSNGTGNTEMTDVGTPRNQTLIVQTFDGKTDNPDNMNPLMGSYALWRGFRELGWGYLWEMDTATGKSYPELAAALPKVMDASYTKFQVSLKKGIYWSDGVQFNADDLMYTLDTYKAGQGKLTYFGVSTLASYVKSWTKVDDYTVEIDTQNPAYDFATVLGVYTWGSALNIVPKHVFEKQADLATFKNTTPVTIGPYTIKSFDPNGQWHLWQLRDDWQRSAWGDLGQPQAKYVYYKNFGDEQTRTLSFIKNQYDVDTFMSPDSIAAAQKQNKAITTFAKTSPYNDMNDACSYGVIMNLAKAPFDKKEVRWALALSLDLASVSINSMSGQVKAGALALPDTQITRPLFYDPLQSWLKDLQLPDGYQPYDTNFASGMVDKLKAAGTDASALPSGDATSSYGLGWWKNDPSEAQKLLASVGITKGADGFYQQNGKTWEIELVIPSDWNKVMQRVGFSIADSWTKAGFKVNTRQVDNGEFTKVQNTNSLLTAEVNWSSSCIFNANYLNSWRSIMPSNVQPVDSTATLNGNLARITDKSMFDLVAKAGKLPQDSAEFKTLGTDGMKIITENMYYINMMNISTTIPTNTTYWTNFPKQDNAYAVPYTWWSSFKKILVSVKPAK
jgi:peptide/nickel transport system substrate-binding protein